MNITTQTNSSAENVEQPRAVEADRTLELFQLYYIPCLVILGVFGNSLSVFVFFKTKLKKLSSSYYLAALAVSDTFFLIALFLVWLTMVGLDVYNKPVACEVINYTSSVSAFFSVWLVLAFTAERFLAVGYPFYRQTVCKVSHTKRARTIILVLLLLALIVYIPYFLFAGVRNIQPRGQTCTIIEGWEKELHVFNIFDTVFTYVIPVVGIAVLNVFISRNMWVMAKVRRRMTHQGSMPSTREDSFLKYKRKSTPVSQYKITKMLLVVSTTCLCLNMPSYIMRLLAGFIESNYLTIPDFGAFVTAQQYCQQLFNTNFGIDFVLYCISGQNFRKAVRSLFCPRPLRRRDTSAITGITDYQRQRVSVFCQLLHAGRTHIINAHAPPPPITVKVGPNPPDHLFCRVSEELPYPVTIKNI